MENPKPLKYDTEAKRRAIALEYCSPGERGPYMSALADHAAPLEQLIAEKDKTIADLREALERVSSECHQQFKSRGAWDPLSNETLAAVDDVLIATKPQL